MRGLQTKEKEESKEKEIIKRRCHMGTPRLIGLFAILPVTALLTISFFVLFTLRTIKENALKVFGYVIVALLWTAALLTFLSGIYTVSTGKCLMRPMMHQMMKMHMQEMMQSGESSSMMQKHTGDSMMKR